MRLGTKGVAVDDDRHVLRGVGVARAVYRELDPHTAQLDSEGRPPRRQRSARLTAETIARSDAVRMFSSMPTPHSTRSPTAHST